MLKIFLFRNKIYIESILFLLLQLPLLQKQAQNIMSRRNYDQIQDSQDEAEEVNQEAIYQDERLDPSEESGEDLIEDQQRDYQKIDKLDNYQDEGVDHQQYQLNPEARKAAEKELKQNERILFQDDLVDEYLEDEQEMQIKRNMVNFYDQQEQYDQQNEFACIDAERQKGRFNNWINVNAVREYIRYHFAKFISLYTLNGSTVYMKLLKQMVLDNKQSLIIKYEHLRTANLQLAMWLVYHPTHLIPQLNFALYALIAKLYPNFKDNNEECFVRIDGLPSNDTIRNLTYKQIGALVNINGVVTLRSEIFSQLIKVNYICYTCGTKKGPFYIYKKTPALGNCFQCQSKGPFILQKNKCIYRNFQKITIQQTPGSVPPGRMPRSKQVILLGDLIDTVKPGDQIHLVGIYMLNYELSLNRIQGFPVFKTYIEANYVASKYEKTKFNQIQEEQFEKFARLPDFDDRFYRGIAPSIFGHINVKKALSMAIFGGQSKSLQKHNTRGDINVLLLGDPGIAKSQFLKSIQKIFARCIYTTGKGASAVGLTACVKHDSETGQWRLQAGALVLADRGLCLIDQFDKMSEADRTSIHEAMQQQTISISKAGIVTTLNARCSVIAAANPYKGSYDETLSFADNVHLSDPIISRFDILLVIKDKHDQFIDSELSKFVIEQHRKNHPYQQEYIQPVAKEIQNEGKMVNQNEKNKQRQIKKEKKQEQHSQLDRKYHLQFIKQYIIYAREKYHPKITSACSKIIQQFYKKIRSFSENSGGLNIVTRHLESIIRICEAHARMHLRTQTTIRDAQFAIYIMLLSFIDTQKYATAQRIRKGFKEELKFQTNS